MVWEGNIDGVEGFGSVLEQELGCGRQTLQDHRNWHSALLQTDQGISKDLARASSGR